MINDRPLDRSQQPNGLKDRAAAPLIAACDADRAMARAAWATIKGLVDLELAARFPPDTDIQAIYNAAARAYTSPHLDPSMRNRDRARSMNWNSAAYCTSERWPASGRTLLSVHMADRVAFTCRVRSGLSAADQLKLGYVAS